MNIREAARSLNARIDPTVHCIQFDGEGFIWTWCGEIFYRKTFEIMIVHVVLPTTCLWCISNEGVW